MDVEGNNSNVRSKSDMGSSVHHTQLQGKPRVAPTYHYNTR